jgi:hypothetical protein
MSTPDPVPHVVVCGPASWNHLISLDRLPEPVPHMQFAESAWHTVGGTSAGKAAHLAALGVPTVRRRTVHTELVMLTISPTHSVLLREGAPGVVAWDPNQQGSRARQWNRPGLRV